MVDQRYLAEFKREHVDPMTRFNGFDGQIKPAGNFTTRTCRAICEICLWLREHGYAYATEVKMKYYKLRRADILVPELYGSQVIEVMDSEGERSIEEKRVTYQTHGVEFLAVPADPAEAIRLIKEANGL